MSRIYTQADYFGIVDDDYTQTIVAKRALRGPLYHASWNGLQGQKILLAGCGMGDMVQEMTDRGFTDVWGCDASAAGIAEGQARFPAIASRLLIGDVLSQGSMNGVRSAAGLPGNQRFRVVVSEDVLPCMANAAEVQTALTRLRAVSQTLAHIITMWEPDSWGFQENGEPNTYRDPVDGSIKHFNGDRVISMPGFLWWTAAEWIAAIGTPAEWVFTPDMRRVQ